MDQADLFSVDVERGVEDRRKLAELRRDLAIQRVERRAERELPGWPEAAYRFLLAYGRTVPSFKVEDVRVAAAAAGFPRPPDAKAWGPVVARAARERVVVKVGTAPADSSNRSLKWLWAIVEDGPAEVR